jgi:diadenosine tetraphosphate (Ap4A) HIT family hydrolase
MPRATNPSNLKRKSKATRGMNFSLAAVALIITALRKNQNDAHVHFHSISNWKHEDGKFF